MPRSAPIATSSFILAVLVIRAAHGAGAQIVWVVWIMRRHAHVDSRAHARRKLARKGARVSVYSARPAHPSDRVEAVPQRSDAAEVDGAVSERGDGRARP